MSDEVEVEQRVDEFEREDPVESGPPSRDVRGMPAHVVVLAFRTPQRAKWFCDEVGWDWRSPRVIYPVHVDDLDNLDLDCTAIVAEGQRVGRWSGMTNVVAARLDDLVDPMDVLLIDEDEFEQEGES